MADALLGYQALLRRPGRYLNGDASCSPGIEPEDDRDRLQEFLRGLPGRRPR